MEDKRWGGGIGDLQQPRVKDRKEGERWGQQCSSRLAIWRYLVSVMVVMNNINEHYLIHSVQDD